MLTMLYLPSPQCFHQKQSKNCVHIHVTCTCLSRMPFTWKNSINIWKRKKKKIRRRNINIILRICLKMGNLPCAISIRHKDLLYTYVWVCVYVCLYVHISLLQYGLSLLLFPSVKSSISIQMKLYLKGELSNYKSCVILWPYCLKDWV